MNLELWSIIPLYRLGFGLLTLAAILTQMVSLIGAGTFDPVNYFTYFTILTWGDTVAV